MREYDAIHPYNHDFSFIYVGIDYCVRILRTKLPITRKFAMDKKEISLNITYAEDSDDSTDNDFEYGDNLECILDQ